MAAKIKTNTKIRKIKKNIDQLTDEVLVSKFMKGCEESFAEIISRYETKVHNLSMRLTRNQEDAEEVLQDVFITVYRKIASFEGKAKFSSWLYRITVNAAFMKLRKKKQDRTVSIEEMLPTIVNQSTTKEHGFGSQSDSLTMNNQIREALENAIGRLPDEYRAVFVLRDVDGLSNKEVGDILNLSIPAVKSRLHRSRIMLRKKLKKFYEDFATETTKSVQPQASFRAAA